MPRGPLRPWYTDAGILPDRQWTPTDVMAGGWYPLWGAFAVGGSPNGHQICWLAANNCKGISSRGPTTLAALQVAFSAKARGVSPKQIPARESGSRTPEGWCGELSQGGKGRAPDRPTERCLGTSFFPTELRVTSRGKYLLKQIQGRAH